MLLYEDILTGDEMFSDAFAPKLVDDIVYEVNCTTITVKPGADVDIGANPSADEQQEVLEEGAEQVNNVVHSFRLQPTTFGKKAYMLYLRGYMKAIEKKLQADAPDRVNAFKDAASAYAKKHIFANFEAYEFFTGSSMDTEGMVALLNYRSDGITPYFTFWKDGLKGVKL